MPEIKILDCTLRDGGYINNWEFGKSVIDDTIEKLTETNVEIFEIGFLKNESYDDNRVVFNSMQQVKNVIGKKKPGIFYTVMCEVVNPLPLDMLEPADNESADAIRVVVWKTKHKDGKIVDALDEGYEYCKGIVEKGYKLCVQPARVDQYSDEEFINMVKKFSNLDPMAIYVVDSWGTQNAEELLHYMHLADDNMPKNIKLGYHGHNNMMQALPVAQAMIKEKFDRDIMIDASVYGIGRGAGNLNLEIIAKYMNEHYGKQYDAIPMLEVYEKYVKPIYEKEKWGYSAQYYLTAKYNCNPAYARFFEQFDISVMDDVLKQLSDEDRVIFKKENVAKYLNKPKKKD